MEFDPKIIRYRGWRNLTSSDLPTSQFKHLSRQSNGFSYMQYNLGLLHIVQCTTPTAWPLQAEKVF
ncbi:unnamed protein product [Ilex paraguariensis]|uniref:Uncharacterized protein n=1 Tax=Ilex paraguariensis TaxID=185542 RepID=A0ABC8SHH6_9AQUA